MLLSFIVVFCLPLSMMILFYFYSEHVMEKQIEISNGNLLQTIQSVCDREIQFYQNILVDMAFTKPVGLITMVSWAVLRMPIRNWIALCLITVLWSVRMSAIGCI